MKKKTEKEQGKKEAQNSQESNNSQSKGVKVKNCKRRGERRNLIEEFSLRLFKRVKLTRMMDARRSSEILRNK